MDRIKKNKFDRSKFMRNLHNTAKARREFYEKVTGSNLKYAEYLKKDNMVDENIVVYDVSYQLNYTSAKHKLQVINPETFRVYAIKSPELERQIVEQTRFAVLDMKGEKSNEGLNITTKSAMHDYVDVNIEPRGMERAHDASISPEVYYRLANNRIDVEGLDTNVTIKNKKGSTAKMKLDISHFM